MSLDEWVSIPQQELKVRLNMYINSRMLASISLKGWNVYRCLATPSAAPGSLSNWLLWSTSASTDVIIQILNPKYPTCQCVRVPRSIQEA